jgi:hypothetical protein
VSASNPATSTDSFTATGPSTNPVSKDDFAQATEPAPAGGDAAISINLSGPTELRFERDGRVIQGFCELKHLRSVASGGVWLNLQHGTADQKNLVDMAHFEGIGVSFSWYLQAQ